MSEVKNPARGYWIDIWDSQDPDTSYEGKCSVCGRISDRPLGSYCKYCGVYMGLEVEQPRKIKLGKSIHMTPQDCYEALKDCYATDNHEDSGFYFTIVPQEVVENLIRILGMMQGVIPTA